MVWVRNHLKDHLVPTPLDPIQLVLDKMGLIKCTRKLYRTHFSTTLVTIQCILPQCSHKKQSLHHPLGNYYTPYSSTLHFLLTLYVPAVPFLSKLPASRPELLLAIQALMEISSYFAVQKKSHS